MRKIPTNENAGRSSPTLTPTTPTGSTPNIMWGSGAGSKPATPASSAGDHLGNVQSSRDSGNQVLGGAPSGSASANWSSSAQDSSQFKFSREFILSLYDPSLPPPPDFEPAAAMTSDRVLEPMANIPLNENEKKLFTSQSVNSEISARRTPYGRGETKEGVVRPPRAPGTAQRGYSNRTDRVGSQSDGYRPTRRADAAGDDDPWDIPAGVGSFSGNGMFARDDDVNMTRNGHDAVREDALLFANRGRDSPARTGSPASLERRDISPGKPAKPLQSGAVNGNHPSGQPRLNEDVSGMSLGGKLGTSDPLVAPIMTRSLSKSDLIQPPNQPPPGIIPASAPFVPQLWQYKDPSGLVQGPFAAAQMHEWFRAGYFSDDLPIKRVDDYSYEPLARLLQKYGRDRPFLADMEEAERLHQQLESQRRVPGIGLSNAATGFRDIYQHEVATPGGSIAYNAFGTFGAGAGAQSTYLPSGTTVSPFDVIGRDRFGTGGFEPLSTGAYGRTSSWAAETPGAIRTGWSALNPEVERRGSPFGRPVAAPGSPAAGMQSSYFDQRTMQAQDGFMNGGSSQRPSTTFTPFSGAQASRTPQSPAANLFSGQSILDFAAAQANSRGKQPEWSNISGLAGSHYHDDAHAPLDVISKLIDESHYEPEEAEHDARTKDMPEQIDEQFSRLSVDPANNVSPVDVSAVQPPSPVKQEPEKPVGKARKTRKEERQERFERENELRKEQQNKLAAAAAAAPATTTAPVTEAETSVSAPAVDLRQIMSEEHNRSKREKENAALENKKRLQAEIEQAEKASNAAVAASSAWGASGGAGSGATEQKGPKLSLKQIQEIERKRAAIEESERARRAHEAMLQQAQMLHDQDALTAAQSLVTGGPVWGGAAAAKPQPSARQKKNLAEIMEEEERRKRKEAELRGVLLAESDLSALPTGSGKRYADTIATVGNSNTIAWGLAAAGARPPVANRPAAVVASGNVVKATAPGAAHAGAAGAARPDENVVGTWNVVGKQGQVVRYV
ncbi:hypothetical protein HDU86_003977 [Geranomyces michiganensis]|nr:hypothetical protein HDU86_003977 [Geranomyces michiganensis]